MSEPWWKHQPTVRYKTDTGLTLATGVPDIEKGDVYNVSPGSPISIPIPSVVAWEDSQHVVLQTNQGIFNFLHVNPDVPVGTRVPSNSPFASVSYIGSPGYPSSYYDPNSHMTYQETGSIIEFGLYDTVKHAANRETIVGGIDKPYDFSGISDPLQIVSHWQSGDIPQNPINPPTALASFPKWIIFFIIALVLFMLWKKKR